ncbi:o-succinylbenzoate--CoA ligase [Affinibrenneria salicis]|uniref:O-succinylbenzoate--CoA ligase n=1 Tax=Affinibrenneria salicis TaxID=2590031 RepID=A0A5J5G0Y9_9GAMM|nr:o-succinylbenzoate--CoA ligase [Affinibrenneria salicis]KAA9000004.1 o-succinylbenzoate--CoA ligase [Affinibrenneria salicis]
MALLSDWPWRAWAAQRPDQTALDDESGACSWHRLCERIDRLAAGFRRQGVTPGRGVALRGKNSGAMLFSYLALLQCGARLLPLNPQLPASLTDALLPSLDIDCGLCLAPRGWPAGITTLRLDDGDGERDGGPLWRADRLATLTLTSGSGGPPKAAAHSYAAHQASARGVVQLMNFAAGDRWLLSLPLFHVSGQGIVWRWLAAGATLVVRERQELAAALRGCTHASLVPTQLWRLLNQPPESLTLRAALLGGAHIPVELTRQAEARGIRCWCGYGLTELASTVCAKRADERPGVGLPLLRCELRLAQDEILLRADSMAAGYWRDGRLWPLTDEQGWFHTRDRGCFEQGEWRILGRLDNQFFSGGEGVQPEDIEAVLLTHPDVAWACVVPVPDVEFGQRPAAVLDMSVALNVEQIDAWLAPRLAVFQRPVAWYRLPPALKNGAVKISRRQVYDWVQRQRTTGR